MKKAKLFAQLLVGMTASCAIVSGALAWQTTGTDEYESKRIIKIACNDGTKWTLDQAKTGSNAGWVAAQEGANMYQHKNVSSAAEEVCKNYGG